MIQGALTPAFKKAFDRIIIESKSQLPVNAIHDKIYVSRDIINLVEGIRNFYTNFKQVTIVYCYRECTREVEKVEFSKKCS